MLAPALMLIAALAQAAAVDPLEHERVARGTGARLDSLLTRFAAYGFSGTVLVTRGGRVVLLKGYGLAHVEKGTPNSATTRFEMNSITKTFTGAAILQLSARGRLRLSDPVGHYLSGLSRAKQKATIEQLAMHTSGVIAENSVLSGQSREAFIRDVARSPVESPPGERYRYSNAGFSLLAAVIETAGAEPYEEYVQRHLFSAAGMRSAMFRYDVPPNDPRFAHGYVGTPHGLVPAPPNPYEWGTVGAGGIWCTVGDIHRWVTALAAGRVLATPEWRRLTTPPAPPALEAFGWHVEKAPDGRDRMSKGGGSQDFSSHVFYYPADTVVVVWASNNQRQRWRATLNRSILAVVFGSAGAESLPPVVVLAPATLEARAGRYLSEGESLDVLTEPSYLYVGENHLGVPADVMFFPQDSVTYTGFDPVSGARFELSFGEAGILTAQLAGGKSVRARRAVVGK